MGRLNKNLIGAIVLGALPLAAGAQNVASVANTTLGPSPSEVGGIPTIDYITLGPVGPGSPLRFGNVIASSESIQLDGVNLQSGTDYLMDYAVGVVYLKVSQRAGQILTASYRYKTGPVAANTATGTQLASISSGSFNLAPGALRMITGLGVTERAKDGSVTTNNVFGLNNTFSLARGTSLNGLYAVSDRERQATSGGLSMDLGGQNSSSTYYHSHSQLIVQGLNSSFLGGSAKLDYQNVGQSFNGFNTLTGVDNSVINRLSAEKGLQRTGFALDNVHVGSAAISNSYRDVKDGESGLFWRTFGLRDGGLKLNFSTQAVDSRFTRFKDLSEANHDQLGQEVGMRRENLNGGWAKEFGKLNYASSKITDDATHSSIHRDEWALNSSKLRFNMGDEQVDSTFMRFGNLLGPEQSQYGREAGMKRQWLGLQASLAGKGMPFSFNQTTLTSTLSSFKSQDAAVGTKTWSLQHVDKNVGNGFTSVGSLSDPEIDSNVRSIANMYAYDIKPTASDRGEFLNSTGIDRKYDGFSTDAVKGWKLTGSALQMKGLTDKGKVDTFSASAKNVILSYRKEDLGTRFNEVNELMDFEKLRLGTLQGFGRQDLSASVIQGKTKMDLNNLDATTQTGRVERSTFAYDDPNKLNVQLGQRSVSKDFADGQSLVDPERNLLSSLAGWNEVDAKIKWNLAPGKALNSFDETQYNPQTGQTWSTRNTVLDWSLDKTTAFNYSDSEQHNNAPLSEIFSSVVSKMSLTKDFGKYGLVKVLDEKDQFAGDYVGLGDQHLDYLGYQIKVSPITTIKSEDSYSTFRNGQTENVNANTISTALSKRTGVSLTDTEVNRSGSNDESHRNYGFWYDLGNGVKLSYGYAREIIPNGQTNETSQGLTLGKAPVAGQPANSIQAGQVGNLMVNGAYYQNQWDANDRTQSNGNISATTVKPLKLGPIQDAKFTINLDTGADYNKTLHENKLYSGQGRIGTNLFGVEYKSQLDPTGNRAIDRTVKLTTDPSDKKLISAGISYKARTMPDNSSVMIRDYNLTFRPAKNVTLVNLLQTNPDVGNPGALLGSIPQASRSNKWDLNFKKTDNLTFGASFQELINDQARSSSQTGGVTVKLFEKIGSPVSLFYGLESADRSDLWRKTQRYSLQYDQHPGPNQTLSLFIGNLSYEHSVPVGAYSNNNTLRLNYQFRF